MNPYIGQLNPNWRDRVKLILDEQNQIMVDIEKKENKKSLPIQGLILFGGVAVVVISLIIIKRKTF